MWWIVPRKIYRVGYRHGLEARAEMQPTNLESYEMRTLYMIREAAESEGFNDLVARADTEIWRREQ